MTEFDLPILQDKIYLKEELRKILNKKRVKALANAKTVIFFSPDTSLDDVEKSVQILLQDIKLRKEVKGGK